MLRFLPWKAAVRRLARAYGFIDPVHWLARIRGFAEPSEVSEPIELLRAGVLLHARGIVNTKAIQHNLDWIWPYWVTRQFDPKDPSFVPRAFSFSHINLTHRNWTAVGLPGQDYYPLIDPRGLVTPLHDGWSLDAIVIDHEGHLLIPSRLSDSCVQQRYHLQDGLAVQTSMHQGGRRLHQDVQLVWRDNQPVLQVDYSASCGEHGTLVVSVRPFNPEGVQFIDAIRTLEGRSGWRVNEEVDIQFAMPAEAVRLSDYRRGDALSTFKATHPVPAHDNQQEVTCDVGMATSAAEFPFHQSMVLRVEIPLPVKTARAKAGSPAPDPLSWQQVRAGIAGLSLPDPMLQRLYDESIQTLLLLSAPEVVPGPYTYRRFWFRDACVMMNAMLSVGMVDRCRQAIARFPARQLRNGYFRSQTGEWDSNGQVLWFLDRFERCSGERLSDELIATIPHAIRWLDRKRLTKAHGTLHEGLLPAGFSAEHFGPNDFYYWDDFWAEAGLRGAANIFRRRSRETDAVGADRLATEMQQAIRQSLDRLPTWRTHGGIPASPYRRMDSGAIGSLVADYPLQLFPPGDPRIKATVDALLRHCTVNGGFFQDMIHSGINAYLTLDLAQSLLRVNDPRFRHLLDAVARLASPTGQWPEAIHPHTGGGCMGDGQHGWAAAEWVMLMRNLFVREESDRLIIGEGLDAKWLVQDQPVRFGPTWTPWGVVTIELTRMQSAPTLAIDGAWRDTNMTLDIRVPGFDRQELKPDQKRIALVRSLITKDNSDPAHYVSDPAHH